MERTTYSIRLSGKAILWSCALWALAAEAAPKNLARYQKAVGSSSGFTLRAELFATDGIASNFHRWRSTSTSGQSLEITYPRPVTIASAHLYTGVISSTTTENWANFKFQSHNGSTWVDIPGGSRSSNTSLEVNVIFSQAVTSDRFRLLSTDASSAVRSVRELAMFGPNVVGSVEQGYPIGTGVVLNLAQKLPATASSIEGTNYAIKAVDGYVDDSSRWLCTAGTAGQTLEIDLLSVAVDANGDRPPALGSAHLYSGDLATSSGALSDFTLEYWNAGTSTWVAIPGATITGNTSNARVIDFSSSVVTNKVRLVNNTTSSAKVAELLLFPPRAGGYALGQDVRMEPPPTARAEDFSDATRHLRVSSANLKLGLVSGNAIFSNDSAGSDALDWQLLLNHRDGSYRIRHIKTGQCLALADLSMAANTLVIGETYTGMPHQCWNVDFVNATQFRLLNVHSGLALQSLSATAGAALAVVTPGASTLQQWDTVWQAHFPKKGIAATGSAFPDAAGETWMSYLSGKFQHTSWSYSWGRDDTFPYFGPDHTFNPMQWGNYFWAHGSTTAPLEGQRNYMQTQGKPFSFLGFNEPDGASQANMTVAQSVALWPRLQSMDAPLVAPCPANPTSSWNIDFYAAVDQLGYRVDYTPLHWYANPNSTSLINKIKELYGLYGRPVWLTEFSAVRWSGTATWTDASNYNFLAEFMWRAEGLPELARYALFNWKHEPLSNIDPPEAPRGNSLDESGNLTPYGELYASWDGIAQVLPQKAYHLHNHGFYQRMQSPATGDAFGFVTPADSSTGTQWFLTPGNTANTYRIQTTRDGRPLIRTSGNPAAMGTSGQVDTATEWTLVPVVSGVNHDGWYYLQHPLTSQRLKNNGNGTCSMVATTDTTNASKWRFIVPMIPDGGTSQPTLASSAITDNQPGGSIATNTPVTYTLTFSEDINAATVTAADFGNAGTAAITIGSILETSPGVFSVQVTPTGGGTLIFRVNAGALITNGMGTALQTTAAIVDDTTITVTAPFVFVTYNGNGSTGGSVPVDNTSYPRGSTVTVLGNTLTKTGHSFTGWNTAANGSGTSYSPGNTFTINADTTLYARWTPDTYTVTFNANGGGTPSPTSKSVTYNATYGTLATVSRAGFVFNGWFTAASAGTEVTDLTLVTTTTNHTLYAQWTATYPISYSGNGNTAGTAPGTQNKLQGIDLTLATNSGNLTKTDYSFTGWNTASDGSGTDYPVGFTYTANAPLTLYAKWVAGVDSTWLPTTAGPFDWGNATNWDLGNVATGAGRTALFTPNIAADQTVNLDSARTIGNITFTDSTTSSHNLTISGANPLTLSRSSGAPILDVTQSGRTLTIASPISGSSGLQKNGAGTLTLSAVNNYSGGMILNGGTLATTDDTNLGAAGGSVTVSGTSTWSLGSVSNAEYARDIAIDENAVLTFTSGSSNPKTISGVLSGNGSLIWGTTTDLYFSNTGNTFNGPITVTRGATTPYGLSLASLGDDTGAGMVNLGATTNTGYLFWYGGTKTFANRQFALAGTTGGGVIDNRGTGALVITKDLSIPVAGNKTLTLGGTNTADNEFAGVIADATGGGVISLSKTGTGTWIVSADNTFTGGVAVGGNGRLVMDGSNQFTGAVTVVGSSGTGTLAFSSIADFGTASALGKGTDGVAIQIGTGTTSPGRLEYIGSTNSSSNRTVQLGSNTASNTAAGELLNNGSGTLTLTATTFNPAIAGITATRTLTLGGTNSGNNTISGIIQDNTIGGLVALSKSGTGTWVLAGANTYTGATTASGGGTLVLDYLVNNSSKLADGAALTLNGSSLVLRRGSHAEDVASFTLTTGQSFLYRDGGSTAKINLNAITRTANSGGTLSIAENNIATTSSANVNGLLTGGITIGSHWVKNDGAGNIVALSSGDYTTLSTAATTATTNYQLTGSLTRTSTASLNSLRIVGDGNDQALNMGTFNLTPSPLTVTMGNGAAGGILYAGGGNDNYTITGTGNLQAQNANQELIIHTAQGTLNVGMKLTMGTQGLTKTGAGSLVLTGASTYTGATRVNQGKLLVHGSLANSAVTVNPAATLGGTGTLGGNTTILGGLEFHLTTPAASHDKLELAATKTLTFSGTSTLTITTNGSAAPGSYTLLTAPGGIIGAPATLQLPSGWAATVSIAGNDLILNVTATSPYETWAAANALTGNNALTTADPDGDALTNLQEFAFGLNPNSPVPQTLLWTVGGPLTQSGPPVLMQLPVQGGPDEFHAVFVRRKDHQAAGLTYTVQFSADLKQWTPDNSGLAVEAENGAGTLEVVSVPFPATVLLLGGQQSAPPKFFRLEVSGN